MKKLIEKEKYRAQLLSKKLDIKRERRFVDKFIDIYINGIKDFHITAKNNYDKAFDNAIILENKLENIYKKNIGLENNKLLLYFLSRLISYINESISFGSTMCRTDTAYIEPLIEKLIKETLFSEDDFLYITNEYLSVSYINVQGDISKKFLSIAEKNKLLSRDSEKIYDIFITLFSFIAKKTYHHDIISYKKILGYIKEKDIELIDFIKTYNVNNTQGCYLLINTLFNFQIAKNRWKDFEMKRSIIELFDKARKTNMPNAFKDKMSEILKGCYNLKIKKFCKSIINKNEWLYDNTTGFKDNVVYRFQKAALWTLGIDI